MLLQSSLNKQMESAENAISSTVFASKQLGLLVDFPTKSVSKHGKEKKVCQYQEMGLESLSQTLYV